MDTEMFHRPNSQAKSSTANSDLSDARFRRFLKDVDSYERHQVFERTVDAFLDVYSQWRKTHQEILKLRLVMLAFELHRLDGGFQCDLVFQDAA